MLLSAILPFTLGALASQAYNSTPPTASSDPTTTCSKLQSQLGSDIVQISGTEYLQAASGAWNLFNDADHPTCIVFPRVAAHVQTAMTSIYQDQVHYAVQSGGHSAMEGWNTIQDGVLITFSHMTNVSYNAQKDTLTIEPGVRWGDAVTTLAAYGVAPLGGRYPDVGAGLLLGGGLSYLSAEYGFSSDSYVEVDVVLVTGQLVTATATNEYSDLFMALKGGVNRFGIVTRYEVMAIHTGTAADKNFFGGLIFYPNSSAEALIKATANYVQKMSDPKAGLLVVLGYTFNATVAAPYAFAAIFYHGSELPNDVYGEFLAIPSTTSTLGPISYVDAHNTLGLLGGTNRGFGQFFAGSAFNGGVEQYMDALCHWNEYVASVNQSTSSATLAITPILDSQIQAGRARGGNPMDPPSGNYAAILLQTQMPAGSLSLPLEVQRAREAFLNGVPRSPGLPIYINECDKNQNAMATYGRYEFLKETYAKYDPTRFNMHFTDGPMGL